MRTLKELGRSYLTITKDLTRVMSRIYHHDQGVPQDFEQAAVWYRRAAEQGYARAQSSLGALYAVTYLHS